MPAIAVLLTNNDPSDFAKRYVNDGDKVVNILRPLRPDWMYQVLAAKDGVLPASVYDFDAYVITGSPASVNDDSLPWLPGLFSFIQAAHAARRAMVGLCFGHQAIAKALGGQVAQSRNGWGLGAAVTHWHSPAPWMTPGRASTRLLAAHNEQVTLLPPGARCLGSSALCPVGAMQLGEHIFTTQFHPEMTRPFMDELLAFLQDKLDATTLAHARASLPDPIDADLFAIWMVRFFEHAWAQPSGSSA